MRRAGGLFQNAKAFGQVGDDLLYQMGFIHFEISSLILEYNPCKDLSNAPYRPRLGFAPVVSTHVTRNLFRTALNARPILWHERFIRFSPTLDHRCLKARIVQIRVIRNDDLQFRRKLLNAVKD